MRRLFIISTLLSIGGIEAFSGNPVQVDIGDLRYDLYEDKVAVVDVLRTPSVVNIPPEVTYEGKVYPVHWIEENAFMGSDFIERVTIPNSISYIGSRAFKGCTSLDSIVIPGSVKGFGGSFHPHSYEEGVFGSCTSLTTVMIEEGVELVGDDMFSNCPSLKYISLPSSLKHVGSMAFSISRIEEVSIPSLESWCRIVFAGSPLVQGTRLLVGGEEIVDLIVPDGITRLSQDVFYGSPSIETARFPHDLTEISHYCFAYCSSLKYLELPLSLESLGEKCFNCCTSLERIDCYAPTPPAFKKEEYVEWAAPPAQSTQSDFECPGTVKPNKEISFDDYFAFRGCDVETIELHVPVGSKEAYEAVKGWNYFARIIDDLDESGIDTLVLGEGDSFDSEASAACIEEKIYTLQGTRVYGDRDKLGRGVYIIKKGSRSRKILIK